MSDRTRNPRRRIFFWGGLIALIGAVSLPFGIARAAGAGGWGGHCGAHHDVDPDEARAHVGDFADRMLDDVDATEDQRDAVHAILDTAVPEALRIRDAGSELKTDLRAELTSPDLDPQALEDLRQDGLSLFDRATGHALDTYVQLSDTLTADQRAELAERMERRGRRWSH